MVPTAFPGENCVLNPPEGFSLDDCGPLPVLRMQDESCMPIVISCWKFTKAEMTEVLATGRVWLRVVGETMQPVSLHGERPFTLPEPATPEQIPDRRDEINLALFELSKRYLELGDQVRILGDLLTPYLSGRQNLIPEIPLVNKDDDDAGGRSHDTEET